MEVGLPQKEKMINLLHGDCLELMKDIPDGSIDMVLTDPPYGTTACKWDSVIPFDKMWEQLDRIIKDNGAIVLFGSEPFSSALRMSNIKNYRYDLIWHKTTSGGFANANKMPMKYHENISIFYKKLPTYNPIFQEYYESTKKRFEKNNSVNRQKQITNSSNEIQKGLSLQGNGVLIDRGKYPESVLKFSSVANCKRVHPTQKPTDLLEYLIKTYTNENETVLDFTMGSGSTGVACVNTGRNFIGIEKDDHYFEVAKNRIEQAEKDRLTQLDFTEVA